MGMTKPVGQEALNALIYVVALCLPACGGTGSGGALTATSSGGVLTVALSPLTGEARMAYSGRFQTRGGKSPYTWKITAGVLPNGLALNPSQGIIEGTPADPGEYELTVRVEDSSQPSSLTASQDIKLTIAPALQVATTALHATFLDQPYEAKLTAWGGVPPYTWGFASGSLPPGLRLDAKVGSISGTPSTGGEFSVTFQVTDSLKPLAAVSAKEFKVSIFGIRLDQYGGLADVPVPGVGTGFFRVAKVDDRWTLVDPEGNAFRMLSVYVVNHIDGGKDYEKLVITKYGDNKFAFITQALRRIRSWAFNTTGEYSASYAIPIGMYGRRDGNSVKMPFIMQVNVSYACEREGAAKEIYSNVTRESYRGWYGNLVDAFDPGLSACAEEKIVRAADRFTGKVETLAASPWLLGVTIDDADRTSGFKSGVTHIHPGWLTAVAAPQQTANAKLKVSYSDTKVYSKLAFCDFMKARYRDDIQALNRSWNSNYTTFDSDGGWGIGKGLLDEDGKNPWMRISKYQGPLTGIPGNVVADLDAWLRVFAQKYFEVMTGASRKVLPRHMVFGPASLDADNRPAVLQAAGEHLDMLQLQTTSYEAGLLARAYDDSRIPCFVWTTFGSQQDSPFNGRPSGRGEDFDNPTQEARGRKYMDYLQAIFSVRASDGSKPVVGMEWWEYVGKVTSGEHSDFGLVSYSGDNAYDGVESRIARGVDSWGYPVGGEANDYGDFISFVRRANLRALQLLISEFGEK